MGREAPVKLTPAEKKAKVWTQMSSAGRIAVLNANQIKIMARLDTLEKKK